MDVTPLKTKPEPIFLSLRVNNTVAIRWARDFFAFSRSKNDFLVPVKMTRPTLIGNDAQASAQAYFAMELSMDSRMKTGWSCPGKGED